jgi:uncharacterized protein (TIGR03000 family)
MYSAVLMLALSAGTESVDFGRDCQGCAYGCSRVVSGCTASHGCHGGGLFARHRERNCQCNASYGYGCSHGAVTGCSTGCYGSQGCHGGLFTHRQSCHGYTGACYAPAACCGTGVIVAPPPGVKPMPKSEPVQAPKKEEAQTSAPATIIVTLPVGARLTVDGIATKSTSERRTLVTPALEVGSTYVYTLRAEMTSNGQALAQEQQVTVRGGQTSTIQFNLSSQGIASR